MVIKTSGDLEIQPLAGDKSLLASKLDSSKYQNPVEGHIGWFHFADDGKYLKHKKQRDAWTPYWKTNRSNTTCGPYPNGRPAVHDFGAACSQQAYYENHYD